MPVPTISPHPNIDEGYRLIPHLPDLVVMLSEAEYDAATIFSFDPDAQLAAGALAVPPSGGLTTAEIPHYRLPGTHLELTAWSRLARACLSGADALDDTTCLAAFLAARADTSGRHA
ncbi:MAG: hypothetical protein CVT77_01460 [Alphaproteobacteria bacterium HGW-Alphaproteobacteria-16]|nr:MAG: hypothetical protein CVT77_01460 [Alphaproteobacteria bacterium HGW-Alphaproteobacteria-16]